MRQGLRVSINEVYNNYYLFLFLLILSNLCKIC